jgi:hypothetical protein
VRRALVLVCLVACNKPAPKVDDDPKAAAVRDSVVKKGPIGTGAPEEGSYALVDVENASAVDRLVTVAGKLGPATLGADELRIPAHATRTFALIADKPVPDDARATFEVTRAIAVDYPPPVTVSDLQDKKGDLFVATAKVKNTVERAASVVVACTYYDAAGKILARPFTVLELAGAAEQPVRFEGPKESEKAVVFVGQVAYKP